MNLQVLPLRVLVSRQVIRDRMDYTGYLAGKTKSEMDILDRLAGRFELQPSQLTVERYLGGDEVPEDEWVELEDKWEMPSTLFNILDGSGEEIRIVESLSCGPRAWAISNMDGFKKHFFMTSQGWKIGPKQWIHQDHFIEDGKLMLNNQRYVIEGGMVDQDEPRWTKVDQGLIMECLNSFSTDKQGNLVRKFTCSMPIPNIKITKVTSAIRVVSSDKENDDDPRIAQCADCTVGSPSI